jgi:hypothetical protein
MSHLYFLNSEQRIRELHRQADEVRRGRRNGNGRPMDASSHPHTVVIRVASSAHDPALEHLLQLDGHRDLNGSRVLVAEVEGEALAALPLDGGEPIADPFRPTAALVEMLRLRALQLSGDSLKRPRLGTRLRRILRGGARRPAMAPATPGNERLLIPHD